MTWHENFLKRFFHDPVDKPFDIKTHENRAKDYAEILGISDLQEAKYSDQIASCMERSLLPKDMKQDFNEIRHPLSDEKIDGLNFEGVDIKEAVKKSLERIAQEAGFDENKAFYIWRNLLDFLLEETKEKDYQRFLPLVPADTRVPDHSIWEHLKVTSVINAYEGYQNNSLFLFSIGPVQSFISQARKTQDLFMGSFILSYLTFIAIEKVVEKYGPTSIIYPDLNKQPLMDLYLTKKRIPIRNSTSKYINIPTIPNRFVAIIGESKEEDIKKWVEEIKDRIKEELKNVKKEIFEELKISLSNEQEDVFDSQLKDFPQVFWVTIPWRIGNNDLKIDNLKDFFTDEKIKSWENLWNFAKNNGEFPPNIGFLYQLIYTAVEKSHRAIKNLREFKQYYESGRKCSVCGERNVLFFWKSKNKGKFTHFNEDAVDLTDKIDRKYLADGEGLCNLCFIKRTFEVYLGRKVDNSFKGFSFPSTADIASMNFVEKAEKEKEFEEYKNHFKKITKENFSYYWLYEENLTEEKFEEELGISLEDEKIKELRTSLKRLYEKAGKPNSYYAVIHLDADDMGKWLSGELLPEIENAYNSDVWKVLPQSFKDELKTTLFCSNSEKEPKKLLTPAIHSAISTALRNYSIEFVRKIVEEEHLGKLIYSGGDDVLAFVNLKDLFDVMEKLRWSFSGHIKIENGKIKVDLNETKGFVEKDGIYYLTMGKEASCSMGIVIAHYKEPLQLVIKKVFEMEKKAKNEGRDRFAISLFKRSGEEREVVLHWKLDKKLVTQILNFLKENMDKERKDYYFSDGFIQKLKTEFIKIKEPSEPVFTTEFKRLSKRAFNKKVRMNEEKTIQEFHQNLEDLYVVVPYNIEYFISSLEIASFLNKGE